MKRRVLKTTSLVVVIIMSTLLLLVGCGQSQKTPDTTSTTVAAVSTAPVSTVPAKPEPVTLKILAPLSALMANGIHTDPVANAIKDATGVTIDWVNKDTISDWENYVGVMLASGDLPDIVCQNLTDDKIRGTIFASNSAIPLDDLIAKYAPNIQKNNQAMMNLMKGFKSNNGDGKLYFIGTGAGSKEQVFDYNDPWGAWYVRWDIYKSIGSPAIKSDEDLLNVMKQMMDKYPKTADGKKTYGLSGFFAETNQFGTWIPDKNIDESMGWMWQNSGPAFYNNNKDNYFMSIYDDNSPWLRSLKLFNKARQMGVLDPECYTMKLSQYQDKCTAGRILVSMASWSGAGQFNADMFSKGKNDIGYAPIPFPYQFGQSTPGLSYGYYPSGAQSFYVTKNCKTPERAIQLLDYTFSDEGTRLVYNGFEGKQWDVVNGIPTRKDEVAKALQAEPDKYIAETGVGEYGCLASCTRDSKLADGYLADLGYGLDSVKKNFTPFQQLFCKDMGGIEYPAEPWLKEIKPIDASFYTYINIGDDSSLVEIQGKVNNYMDIQAPLLVSSKSDAEFADKWLKFKEGMKAIGYEKLYTAAKAALDKARASYTPETGFTSN